MEITVLLTVNALRKSAQISNALPGLTPVGWTGINLAREGTPSH